MTIKFKSYRSSVEGKLNKNKKAATSAVGQFIKSKAVDYSPVDKGNLRSSNSTSVSGSSVRVGNTAEYAGYVELGTSKMASQPYLTPAFTRNRSEIKSLIEQHYKG